MKSEILWVIDNEIDSKAFERLCTDILYAKTQMIDGRC